MTYLMRFLACLVLLFAIPQAAHAAWLEASSAHFIVYADDSEKHIRRFAGELERYHAAMAFLVNQSSRDPSPSGRVTIFVVKNDREVRRLYGEGSRYISGFYIPRAGGSIAVVPRIKLKRGEIDMSMLALLHEYAHHFLISNSRFPMPRWYSEGSAEFFASASFGSDGSVMLGRPATHRGPELFLARDVRVGDLIDSDAYEKKKRSGYDAYYGKSWLLFHFLTFSAERKGQLKLYLRRMSEGKSSRDAGLEAFGDFHRLEKDLDSYLVRRKLNVLKFPTNLLKLKPILVRTLRDGEAAMMPVRIRSRRGVNEEQAAELKNDARRIAALYPYDPAVLTALAEAEYDSGNPNRAILAADRALAIDPGQKNAYVQKGFALFQLAAGAVADPDEGRAEAYKRARKPFLALNKLENDHPLPLIFYYRSFIELGQTPSKLAIEGLEWASELAPFDLGLKVSVAIQQLRDGRTADARRTLIPVAYNPHGRELAQKAREIIDQIDSGETISGGFEMLDLPKIDDADEEDEQRRLAH